METGGTSGSVGIGSFLGTVINNSVLAVNRSNTLTLASMISGTGQFNQIGSGTTILTAGNTYTGNTTIAAGTLQLGNGGTTGSVVGAITDDGILAINHSNSFTLSNLITGTGQLVQTGTGQSIISRDNTYTGLTTVSAGTLQLGNGSLTGAVVGDIRDNASLAVNHSNVLTLPGAISGTGTFTQLGTGGTIFTADNTYTGSTTIASGILQLGDGHTTGSVAGASSTAACSPSIARMP